MKTSVVIIAKNEEKHIGKCLSSIFNQTQLPDEVILVLGESIDRTEDIARKFPIKIIHQEECGILEARIQGFNFSTGDIILHTEADSEVEKNWIEEMVKELNQKDLVGSLVILRGTFISSLLGFINMIFKLSKFSKHEDNIWGPSFGFWCKDKELVIFTIQELPKIAEILNLKYCPDDYWLAKTFSDQGKRLGFTYKTKVNSWVKEENSLLFLKRNFTNIKIGKKLKNYKK